MRKLAKEPLVHFLLLGVSFFALYSWLSDENQATHSNIDVSAAKIEHLATLFARTWQRPPTRLELDKLIQDHIREEAAYREGLALGLDRDDTIIRRRIRQKLDFIAEDLARIAEPTDDDLNAHLAAHAQDFRIEPRICFHQVYLDPQRRGQAVDSDAVELLAALNDDPTIDANQVGDRTLLEPAYDDASLCEVRSLFGDDFAAGLVALQPGAWHGPLPSAYGLHLVRVDGRTEGRIPRLEEVRQAVRLAWENSRRLQVLDEFYRTMVARYAVTIEWPRTAPAEPGA